MITALALAAAGPAPLTDATAACPPALLVGEPTGHRDLTSAARAALTDALRALPASQRERAPVVLAVSGPCTAVASWYALRCQDTTRRLRPSESIRLEVAERIRGAEFDAWRGPCYLLASPAVDGGQAVRAGVALRRRHSAVLVGELLLLADDVADDPDGVRAGALAVMAVLAEPAGDPPTLPPPGPAGSVLLALASRLTTAARPPAAPAPCLVTQTSRPTGQRPDPTEQRLAPAGQQ